MLCHLMACFCLHALHIRLESVFSLRHTTTTPLNSHCAGHEKLLRIFDAERPEAAPQEFPQASGPIRCVKWTKSDDVLLTSDLDKPGIT